MQHFRIKHRDGRYRTLDRHGCPGWTTNVEEALSFTQFKHAYAYNTDDPAYVFIETVNPRQALEFSTWFAGLPEARQAYLRENPWLAATAAFDFALTMPFPHPAFPDVHAWLDSLPAPVRDRLLEDSIIAMDAAFNAGAQRSA